MTSEKASPSAQKATLLSPSLFSLLFGLFFGLALLKFCNPPSMEKYVQPPVGMVEWLIMSWPVRVGYGLLMLVAFAGLFSANWRMPSRKWLAAVPLVWLGWQFLAATQSVDAPLTAQTLKHFVACVVCFYLGLFCLNSDRAGGFLWAGVVVGMAGVLWSGWEQHFGGLQETREYFYTYMQDQLANVPPEYLKKISSNRIFGTLFYPNALAGAILLFLPGSLVWILRVFDRLTVASRFVLAGAFGAVALACLYWSGSKGGWLLALFMVLVVLLHLNWSKRAKAVLVAAVLVCGVAGFWIKYANFFQRGATSVVARFDYWQAALQTALKKPVFGSGPGTFSVVYQAIKKPESEMARLTHNDYLQQASDSGVIGFLSYAAFAVGVLAFGYGRPVEREGILRFAVWLGWLGWALQGLFEFGLYIPALAWPAFGLAGWLLSLKPVDKAAAPS